MSVLYVYIARRTPAGPHQALLVLFLEHFPGASDGKESACNAGDLGSIPGLGKSLGEGNNHPLQYSCLENPVDRGHCWAIVHEVAKSQTRLSFSFFTFLGDSDSKESTCSVGDLGSFPWL